MRKNYTRNNPKILNDLIKIRAEIEDFLNETVEFLTFDNQVVTLQTNTATNATQEQVIQDIIDEYYFVDPEDKRDYTIKVGKNTNAQNVYLEDEFQNHTNLNPEKIPRDSLIWAVSARSDDAVSWDLELYVNNNLKDYFSINSSTSSINIFDVSIELKKGDEISFFCRSTSLVSKPKARVYLQTTT